MSDYVTTSYPASLDPLDAVMWCLEEADDQLAFIGGQLLAVATVHSADALGMTVEQFMTSDDDTGQAGDHDPSDELGHTVYDELYEHVSRAQVCAKALAAFLTAFEQKTETQGR